MKNKLSAILLLLLLSVPVFSQKIDHTASYRDLKGNRYFRFNYDNDYFASSDRNYTQGYNFELVSPAMGKNPLNTLFFKPANSEKRYGISLEHIGFTPDNIKSGDIQSDDRPFAAAFMLKSFAIATDTIHKARVVSSFSIGLIGPGAFGKEMQVAIHQATGNTIPKGWKNQIKNDIVLQYGLDYEKQLVRYRNLLSLQANTSVRLGTLFTNASVGLNGVFGIINSPFEPLKRKNKFLVYAYAHPKVTVVGYDATFQGGLFNHKSPYTIASSDMERFTAQLGYGFVLQTRSLYFEYAREAITREFSYGPSAKWGGIRVGFKF